MKLIGACSHLLTRKGALLRNTQQARNVFRGLI